MGQAIVLGFALRKVMCIATLGARVTWVEAADSGSPVWVGI